MPERGTAWTSTPLTSESSRSESMPPRPRWSAVTFVTTATSARSKPRPSRRIPPRATSNTPVSTVGFWRIIRADFGPDMSPRRIVRPSTTMPSVEVIPTRRPISLRMWAIIRTVVVFPFVPVTPMIGMRAGAPGGKSRSMTGLATYCGSPSVGWVCIRKPGAALTSTIAPPVSRTGTVMSGQMKSMPATSSPTTRAAISAISTLSGWASMRPIDRRPAGRHVAGERELDPLALRRHAVELEALRLHQGLGGRVELDPRQHLLVADAAAWVRIRSLHELADGALAVADDGGRHALGDRRDLAADDEAAVVVAGHERLDHEVAAAALAPCSLEGGPDLVVRAQVQVHATPVIAVERLDDARQPDPLRRDERAPRPS